MVGTGISAYKSIKEGHDASEINKNNPRPTYNIPQEYYDNLNIANQMAQQGIPQQQYNNQINNIGQNQASALAQQNRSANPGANLSAIVRQGDLATGSLNAADAGQRENNLRLAMQSRGDLAQQKLAKQQYNKFDKYTEQFNKAAALQGASNQNLGNAINGATSIATNLAKYNSTFPNTTTGTTPQSSQPAYATGDTPVDNPYATNPFNNMA